MSDGSRIRLTFLCVGLEWGGAERFILDIATRLDLVRFQVTVVSLKGEGPVGQLLRKAGIPVVSLHTSWTSPWTAYFRWKSFLRKENPHIVHAHLHFANLLACFSRSHHRVMTHYHYIVKVGNPLSRALEKQWILRSDQLIVVSEAVERNIRELFPKAQSRVKLLYNGVDLMRFRPPEPEEKQKLRDKYGIKSHTVVFGFVGRLEEPIKGLGVLLRSFRDVHQANPESLLVMVGQGPDRASLERMTEDFGIAPSVRWMGSTDETNLLYRFFDIFVLPSLSEGFPMVLLEAMASGLPVVASDVGGISEAIPNDSFGLCVPPGDSERLTENLLTLLGNAKKRAQLGLAARNRIEEKFDILQTTRRLAELYERIQPLTNDL